MELEHLTLTLDTDVVYKVKALGLELFEAVDPSLLGGEMWWMAAVVNDKLQGSPRPTAPNPFHSVAEEQSESTGTIESPPTTPAILDSPALPNSSKPKGSNRDINSPTAEAYVKQQFAALSLKIASVEKKPNDKTERLGAETSPSAVQDRDASSTRQQGQEGNDRNTADVAVLSHRVNTTDDAVPVTPLTLAEESPYGPIGGARWMSSTEPVVGVNVACPSADADAPLPPADPQSLLRESPEESPYGPTTKDSNTELNDELKKRDPAVFEVPNPDPPSNAPLGVAAAPVADIVEDANVDEKADIAPVVSTLGARSASGLSGASQATSAQAAAGNDHAIDLTPASAIVDTDASSEFSREIVQPPDEPVLLKCEEEAKGHNKFAAVWTAANPRNGYLGAMDVQRALKRSNLADSILRRVWKEAKKPTPPLDKMSEAEFLHACELVVKAGGVLLGDDKSAGHVVDSAAAAAAAADAAAAAAVGAAAAATVGVDDGTVAAAAIAVPDYYSVWMMAEPQVGLFADKTATSSIRLPSNLASKTLISRCVCVDFCIFSQTALL